MNTPGEHEYHSFQVVFNTYYNSLCNYARSFLRDENASEDIVQEVFTRVWERRRDLIGSEEIRYYLFTAVRNNCISQMRKEKKRGVTDWDNGSAGSAQDKEYTQHKDSGEKEYRALIHTAIEGLPPGCREVFLLSRLSGMTYKEIAKSLDISEKTVENQMSKALKLMRSFLKERGIYLVWAALANVFL
jgi:RNA polymerase sigma-70 factor (ECF subfamily)